MLNSIKKGLRKILPYSAILFYHKIKAVTAAVFNGFPAKKMTIIGVTGTNGKTTTVNLTSSILSEAGFKTAHVSTINFKIDKKFWENKTKMTTISPFQLQKFLKTAFKAGCEYVVLETTSHAVVQSRMWGIPFDVMVFTNLSHEHLDYHKNMTEYRNTKGMYFKNLMKSLKKPGVKKVAIINQDDPSFEYFWKFPADIKFAFSVGGIKEKDWQIKAQKVFSDILGNRFEVETSFGKTEIRSSLPGKFNIQNSLAAIAVGLSQNIELENIKKGIEAVNQMPGRMESIDCGQDFAVIVDYAHTPDALKKVFETIKPLVHGKIISVLGAAGDRDKSKRPILGALAGQFADFVIVTNEDPYGEDPHKIIDQVASGIPKGSKRKVLVEGEDFFKIFDRKDAIKFAFKNASSGDLVLITGKGAEAWMIVGDKKVPWDDRKICRELINNL